MAERSALRRTGPAGPGNWADPTPPDGRRPPVAPRERRPLLAALALLLIVGGALGAAYLVVQTGQRVWAIEVDRQVGLGQRIPAGAMRPVQIAVGSGVSYVPWSEAGQVARYYAATAIPPGTLLSSAMVARGSELAAGRAVVGLALKDGQMPAGLQVGDQVDIYQVSNAAQSCPGFPGGALAADAVVLAISLPPANSGSATTDVELAVDPADAGPVACHAANGTAGVVEMPAVGRAANSAPGTGQPPAPSQSPAKTRPAGGRRSRPHAASSESATPTAPAPTPGG